VHAGRAPDGAAGVEQIHRAQIAEERHRQPRHPLQHVLIVQRRAQDGGELSEEERVLLDGPGRACHGFGSDSLTSHRACQPGPDEKGWETRFFTSPTRGGVKFWNV
jgi:hypothetical protein